MYYSSYNVLSYDMLCIVHSAAINVAVYKLLDSVTWPSATHSMFIVLR